MGEDIASVVDTAHFRPPAAGGPCGYLKRLDFDFCLSLDKQGEALARFLYGHLLKRIDEKSIYQRSLIGFLSLDSQVFSGGHHRHVPHDLMRSVL